MTAPKETWTDPRLNEFGKPVDAGFTKVDERLEKVDKKIDTVAGELRGEMKAGFEKADKKMEGLFEKADAKMDAGFARVDADIRELRGEIKWLIYGLVPIGATFIHSLISWFA